MKTRTRAFWVVLRPGEDTACYLAHALDNDFMAPGRNPRAALANLIELMQVQELTEREDGGDFETRPPAPEAHWIQRNALLGQHHLVPMTEAALRTLGRERRPAVVVLDIPAAGAKPQVEETVIKRLLSQARIAA